MNTAKKIRPLGDTASGRQDAALYECSPPMRLPDGGETRFVMVDAIAHVGDDIGRLLTFLLGYPDGPYPAGPETSIFACTQEGEVLDWDQLPGSFLGGMSHDVALRGAGYAITKEKGNSNAAE